MWTLSAASSAGLDNENGKAQWERKVKWVRDAAKVKIGYSDFHGTELRRLEKSRAIELDIDESGIDVVTPLEAFIITMICIYVCQFLRTAVDQCPTAQYAIELAVSGMEDGAHSQLTATSRLALLKERNFCWDALRWGATKDLSLPLQDSGDLWELSGGIFAQSHLSANPPSLRLLQFPSQYRNIRVNSWRIPLLRNIQDFTIDPVQDLLVLVEKPIVIPTHNNVKEHVRIHIHLLSMATGQVHPSVAVQVINHDLDMQCTSEDLHLSIQVSGGLLGVLFLPSNDNPPYNKIPEVAVWDWMRGELVLIRSSREIATFAFLTSHLLLVGAVMNKVDIAEPGLYVLVISASNIKLTLTGDYICAFRFPSFDLVVSPEVILIRSDPSPEWKPNREVPFSIACGHRLFSITIQVKIEGSKKIVTYNLFTLASILSSYVTSLPRQTRRHTIKWDTWGPTGTRFLKSPPHSHDVWTGYVFGSKFVSLITPPKSRAGQPLQTIQVWDFNQLAFKRAKALGVEKDNVHYVSDTTVVEDLDMFVKTIRTSLPYSVATRTLPPPRSPEDPTFTYAMCSEDTIFLVDEKRRRGRVFIF
ncbi:hypothetical protein CY34DRAFT_769076 [Suillus luteus UH-Slu-Lm8-n1]|uniref:Uncharacterized protein n=1 Tax=Suillus luteus UH-Slu-Lm8-n1 TaxID=930992 RepID=A0A0D0ANI9_9AGAM|nr:hypothetical protein CY34DRAFT_769076 [Suillus luteus UH-Slu-Lm8-n1]